MTAAIPTLFRSLMRVLAERDRWYAALVWVLLAFMPVFFLSTGLRTRWAMGGSAVLLAAGGLLLAAVVGKLLGTTLAGRILGWARGEAAIIRPSPRCCSWRSPARC